MSIQVYQPNVSSAHSDLSIQINNYICQLPVMFCPLKNFTSTTLFTPPYICRRKKSHVSIYPWKNNVLKVLLCLTFRNCLESAIGQRINFQFELTFLWAVDRKKPMNYVSTVDVKIFELIAQMECIHNY